MNDAPVNALAAIDAIRARAESSPLATTTELRNCDEARAAMAQLIAAAEPVLRGGMTTVRDRMEMTRRLRVLSDAVARAKGGAA